MVVGLLGGLACVGGLVGGLVCGGSLVGGLACGGRSCRWSSCGLVCLLNLSSSGFQSQKYRDYVFMYRY